MAKYTVLKSYDVIEIHQVEADNEEAAIEAAWKSVDPVRVFDGPYDDTVSVSEGWEHE
jgi:hypothetical protein